MKKIIIIILDILLVLAMCLHVGIAMANHAKHPEYSAPASAELLNAVYYLIPLILINVAYLVMWLIARKKV